MLKHLFLALSLAVNFAAAQSTVSIDIMNLLNYFPNWGNVGLASTQTVNNGSVSWVMSDFNYQGVEFYQGYTVNDVTGKYLHLEIQADIDPVDAMVPTELKVFLMDTVSSEQAVTLCLQSAVSRSRSYDVPLNLFESVLVDNQFQSSMVMKFESLIYGGQKPLSGSVTVTKLSINEGLTTGAVQVQSLTDQMCGGVHPVHLPNKNGRVVPLDPLSDSPQSTFNNAWQYGDEGHSANIVEKNQYVVESGASTPSEMKAGFSFRGICLQQSDAECGEKYLRDALYPVVLNQNSTIRFKAKLMDANKPNGVHFDFEFFDDSGQLSRVSTAVQSLTQTEEEYTVSIPAPGLRGGGSVKPVFQMILKLQEYDSVIYLYDVEISDVGGLAFDCGPLNHLEGAQCKQNVCQCIGGEVDQGTECYQHGAQGNCALCNGGYAQSENEYGMTVCKPCECANGQVDASSQCTAENLQGICQSCDLGYELEYGSTTTCVTNCYGCLASCELDDAETLLRVYSELKHCGGPPAPVHTGGAECSYSCLAAKCEFYHQLETRYLELATKPQAC